MSRPLGVPVRTRLVRSPFDRIEDPETGLLYDVRKDNMGRLVFSLSGHDKHRVIIGEQKHFKRSLVTIQIVRSHAVLRRLTRALNDKRIALERKASRRLRR